MSESIVAQRATEDKVAEIKRALDILFEPGDVVELRIPKSAWGVMSGYFTDMNKLAQEAAKFDGKVPGIYVTANPVNPALLARANNRIRTSKTGLTTTSDSDIVRRRWLLLDFDPKRPADISSTDAEHEAALARARQAREWFRGQGWPEPVFADSGNGAHLPYRIDLPNDEECRKLMERCLKALAFLFADDVVDIDVKVANAARIWKLYGTMTCKGDNLPERPHRRSAILEIPQKLEPVPRELLERLAAMLPAEPKPEPGRYPASYKPFDIETWISEHGLAVSKTKAWNGGTVYELETCPFNPEHRRTARIIQAASGALAFGCFHNSCAGKDWHALRDLIEPGWRDHKVSQQINQAAIPQKQTKPAWTPKIITAADLLKKELPEPVWIIPGILTEGVSILAGKPKLGKSWMALGIAIATACGGCALGKIPVEQREVLYLALEDSERRLQDRVKTLLKGAPAPEGLYLVNEWLRLDDGGTAALEKWLSEHPGVRLVIIDVLKRIRPREKANRNLYDVDYEAIATLKSIADKYKVSLLILHHTSKRECEDFVDSLSGSTGLPGAADTIWVLKRSRGQADGELAITGRDLEETEIALTFDTHAGGWVLLGDAEEYRMSRERRQIIEVLQNSGEAMSPKEIAEALERPHGAVKKLLYTMSKDGEVKLLSRGKYTIGNHSNFGNMVSSVTTVTLESKAEESYRKVTESYREGYREIEAESLGQQASPAKVTKVTVGSKTASERPSVQETFPDREVFDL